MKMFTRNFLRIIINDNKKFYRIEKNRVLFLQNIHFSFIYK
jgi:hypothetical protein